MAADTASPLTSTSHTLTAEPNMAPASSDTTAGSMALLRSLQPENRHIFLQPGADLPTESLNVLKNILEAFAAEVGEEQQQRQKENRKRKRGGEKEDVLKLRKIYIDGFETNQVWQQAKRVIGGVLKFSDSVLEELEENNEIITESAEIDAQSESEDDEADGEIEVDLNDDGGDSVLVPDEEDEEGRDNGLELAEEEFDDDDDDQGDDELVGGVELGDEEEVEDEHGGQDVDGDAESYAEDPDGLNDGFFSIDDFNKQTQWFEEQDTRGDPYTDQASDEEEIDWMADPNAPSKKSATAGKSKHDLEDEGLEDNEEEDDEDGPTFGDMALDAPEGDSEDEVDFEEAGEDDDVENNANDIFYKDFFAPPSKKGKGNKPKRQEPKAEKPAEADVERAIADVRRDLFDDESDMEGSEEEMSDASAGDPKSRRSAHERRQAKLAEEIRKLEAASVAKREWTLSGEAAAADRPMNSLLEQDLDFEHIGKPVPVITPEISESIEDLIKRRILSQEFDEVLRRRPETESVPAGTRRGLVELEDTKSGKGLAQLYEEEHVKNADPDNYVSQSDEKLQKEEGEVETMWKDVCAKLDALSSWHYKPKPTAATLSVVADVGTVSMEDAQPTTSQGVAGESSRMAPQEVYKAGAETAAKGEIVSKSGLPMAKQEMSREDKTRRRRQHKERIRKAGNGGPGGTRAATSKKAQTIADLKKGGVKVINRKGEITDVEGNKVKAAKAMSSGNFKL